MISYEHAAQARADGNPDEENDFPIKKMFACAVRVLRQKASERAVCESNTSPAAAAGDRPDPVFSQERPQSSPL